MPDVSITIGGRQFEVACQDGEESFLKAAAEVLDGEARLLTDQVGRLAENRMLLMAGLMLADKTVALEEAAGSSKQKLEDARTAARVAASTPPERVEVPVVPEKLVDTLAELAARAEALAEKAESNE
ncbi:MAG: cell division protein ZapA [Rhodobacteraceae bacterium]|jgi:cell division protein ZapA|nr:cell division protein ZapA [Paracoccaceae bacterium]MBC66235.1 cell division protein ZapA [Paracoccaceae bacterium]MDC0151535.1 cell division protein ZapA [Paracoccaceae bacterium]RZO36861.1 MAG: cell division protein ZapA [Paracoccaceae bacterium]|tara:strand:+ start:191 stop:571 length:381 start_codon:yes stop_codon:yes gene_type:complete